MSAIIKTEAVVLRSMKYRDSSKIVTLYTRDHGKVSVIVKGARQAKNKYGSSLEPMSYVAVVYYDKDGRDLQTLAQCDVIVPLRTLAEDLDKMSVGMTMIELVHIITHQQEENMPLFSLLVDALKTLNAAHKQPNNVLSFFEIHLAKILGFRPSFDRCVSCSASIETMVEGRHELFFHVGKGGPLCERCSNVAGQKVSIANHTLTSLNRIAFSGTTDELFEIDIDDISRGEIENFLWNYLRYHVGGMRPLKAGKVFSKISA